MLREDIPVWYRFLDAHSHLLINLYYDCLLGGPALSIAEEKDPLKVMWRANTSKRADAIAETAKKTFIIEVSYDPKQQALGQLLNYETLWLLDPKISKPVELILVCNRFDPELALSWKQHNISLYVV
jgi:hypothetical protein